MRNALPVRASVSIRRIATRGDPIGIKRAPQYRERSSGCIAVQSEELLVEQRQLRSRLIRGPSDGVCASQRQLLEHVILKCGCRHGGGGYDGECNPDPFGVEEEKQLVVDDRAAETAPEMIYRGARLVISKRGVGEEICR